MDAIQTPDLYLIDVRPAPGVIRCGLFWARGRCPPKVHIPELGVWVKVPGVAALPSCGINIDLEVFDEPVPS